jgi:hypothetical protein
VSVVRGRGDVGSRNKFKCARVRISMRCSFCFALIFDNTNNAVGGSSPVSDSDRSVDGAGAGNWRCGDSSAKLKKLRRGNNDWRAVAGE